MNQIKKIGVFTSGGDSPGMNAAVRAVVRTALYYNIEVVGIRRGYEGMINGEFVEMDRKSVANIICTEAKRTPEEKQHQGWGTLATSIARCIVVSINPNLLP